MDAQTIINKVLEAVEDFKVNHSYPDIDSLAKELGVPSNGLYTAWRSSLGPDDQANVIEIILTHLWSDEPFFE